MTVVLTPGPFAELFYDSEERQCVFEGLQRAIWGSFGVDAVQDLRKPKITRAETKRRFAICERWFRVLRGDFAWSTTHILDVLPTLLRAELEGRPIDPTRFQRSWPVPDSTREGVVDPTGPDLTKESGDDSDNR